VQVPKSRGGETPFYPQAFERGRRSCRAVMLAVAQMYIQGVSTRDVEKVMAEFGLESLSSSQVSRAATLMDAELEAWRRRPLGVFPYLFLDARYEKVRIDGVVRDTAILSAIGIGVGYADSAPRLAAWLEHNVPEGLTVFSLPEAHWRRMRTANPSERAIQQELKRRTKKVRVFPKEAALNRLATAILVEIDEEWIAKNRTYVTMDNRDG
jgi:transposase-like protein